MVLERRETPEWRNAMNWIERLWRAAQSRKPKARKYCARDFLVPVLCIPTEDGWWATLSLWRALVFRADPESTIYCPLSPMCPALPPPLTPVPPHAALKCPPQICFLPGLESGRPLASQVLRLICMEPDLPHLQGWGTWLAGLSAPQTVPKKCSWMLFWTFTAYCLFVTCFLARKHSQKSA